MIPIWSTSGSHISLAVKIGSTPSDFPAWIPEICMPKLREKIIENVNRGHTKISYPIARKHPDAYMFSIRLILTQINIQPFLYFFLHQDFFVTVILLIIKCITQTHLILGFQWNFPSGQGIQQYWHQVTYIDYRADVHQTSPTTRLKKYLLYLYRMSP